MACAALLTVAIHAAPVAAAGRCEFDGGYPTGWYPIRGGTTVGGKRLVGLVTRYWPNGVPVMDVVADAGDGTEETIATGEFDERRGRWRLESPFVPPDEAGLDLRLKRCKRFVGRLKLAGKPARRIVAVRATCGDGLVDARAGEDCEPGAAACAGGTCTNRCTCRGSGGRLDTTFGTDGQATIPGGGGIDCPARVPCRSGGVARIVPNADGTMLVVGTGVDRFGDPAFLDRLLDDGTVDPSYHQRTSGLPAPFIDVTPDGRIMWLQSYPDGAYAVRLWPNGMADLNFVIQPGLPGLLTDAAATADGGIVAIGNGPITRWGADGSVQFVDLPAGWTAAAVDDATRVLALRTEGGLQLGRFLASGSPDPTFAGGGPVCITATMPSTAPTVVELNDGSLLVAVPVDGGHRLTRVPTDGAGFDTTCASEPASIVAPVVPTFVQPDGKYIGMDRGDAPRIVRMLPDGTPDLDFGRLGTLETVDAPTTMAVDSQGRILAGRRSASYTNTRLLDRYLP